ncbi:unnamed protein product [Schistocephalus solidus]|uniref:Non-lysosomal glucosylceramidase n=1 Tax=Schistocephalus solidus TaxID=70667 RepID=A0A183SJJ4_SCHSO|nr:unnamed protein product [Schistocephalus solidus]
MFRYYFKIYQPNKREKTLPYMDFLNPVHMEPMYGVPLGGIGCGTIGRGFRGEFCRSSISPGLYCHRIHPADQFILNVRHGNQVYQRVLAAGKPPLKSGSSLHQWDWEFPGKDGHYVGLYPRSWTAFELPEFDLLLVCEQVSRYFKIDCLPVGVFHWTVYNFNKSDPVEVSITMTWRGPRYPSRPYPSNCGSAGAQCSRVASSLGPEDELTAPFSHESDPRLWGCLMETRIGGDMPCTYGLAASTTDKVSVTRCTGFQFTTCNKSPSSRSSPSSVSPESGVNGDNPTTRPLTEAPTASDFWSSLKKNGHLEDDSTGFHLKKTSKHAPKLGMAVCVKCTVPAASETPGRRTFDFFLTWHMPRVHFRSAQVAYTRRYVRWFPENPVNGTSELLSYAASHWQTWKKAIEDWQAPIVKDPPMATDEMPSSGLNGQLIQFQTSGLTGTRFFVTCMPFVFSSNLPDWYKSALFNELYYLSDGGTVWLDPLPASQAELPSSTPANPLPPIDSVRSRNPKVILDPVDLSGRRAAARELCECSEEERCKVNTFRARAVLGNEMGLFGYLEGHEYRMYNTYDVHFYASWALILLWPKIQLAVNCDLADMTLSEDSAEVTYIYNNARGFCSNRLSVPHDCGDPEREPWYNINAYTLKQTDEWKDLNPKFVLMAWRDWKLTGDENYLLYMVPIVVAVIRNSLQKWDRDNDGIIESGGFPDQTYDTWKTEGLSAYVGGLWIAALYAAHEMMQAASLTTSNPAGDTNNWSETKDNLESLLKRASKTYHESLWTGEFYRYSTSSNLTTTPVLADHLCGHWYLRLTGAPADAIIPHDAVVSSLRSIVKLNWKSIESGKLGAVNGVLPNGALETSNMQSEEFWVAINYCLGSLLMLEDMPEDGFELTRVCFEHVYSQMGLHFQTPEAYTKDQTFRSLGYMRPLAFWSIHQALKLTHP